MGIREEKVEGAIVDVYTRRLSGLEDKVVCNSKLAADMVIHCIRMPLHWLPI